MTRLERETVRISARQLGLVVGGGLAAALGVGLVLGLAKDESVLRWIAYMLYVAGAMVVGFAFLTGAPPSPRKLARERLLNKDAQPEDPANKPFASELVVLTVGGVVLFGVGALLELLL